MPAGRRWVGVLVLALTAGGFAAGSPRATSSGSWLAAGPHPKTARVPLLWAAADRRPDLPAASSAAAEPAPVTTTTIPCQPASLEERAGRVLLVGLPDVTSPRDPLLGELADIGVGGVLLNYKNVVDAAQVKTLVGALKATVDPHLLVAADEEPGRVRTFEDQLGYVPSARRLAGDQTATQVRDLARQTGQFLSGVGVTVDLAPVADLDDGPWDNTIGDRSFSGDAATAGDYALAYARGLEDAGITPVVKHFPGRSGATGDDHVGDAISTTPLNRLVAADVAPFRQLVDAGAPVVMMGNVVYDALDPDAPASMSPAAYDLLRASGFDGVAITDSIGMGAVNLNWDYGEATVKAIAAGADGVLGTDGWGARWMRDALVDAVHSGQLSEARLNDAAAHMVALTGGDPQAVACRRADLPDLR